jgi:hypothetical protein
MKLKTPENANYSAVVVEIKSLTQLEGCDNVVGTPLLGFQAIVGKDTKPGDLGIVFPAETQLSEEYARINNLHRHGNLNEDEGSVGYLEDNRRVKAMKFRGHRSDCLFMPLESLLYTNVFWDDLKVGDTFDTLEGHEICRKYVVKTSNKEQRIEKNKDKFIRVDKKYLPEHYDSDNFFRNMDVVPDDKPVVITQKLHGTSIRVGHTIVARQLNFLDKLAKKVGIKVQETEYDYVFGSRKVIKDANNPDQNHFYSTDIWTEEGRKLEGLIPEGYIVYGELVGYTAGNSPIQKNYTYQVPEGTCELYVYRVGFINGQGVLSDLAWEQTVEFCRDRGLKTVPTLWTTTMGEFKERVNDFMDKKFFEGGYPQAVPLAAESPCDEGVCVRVDGLAPYILKAKSPLFYEHETKMLDEEAEDLESEQSDVE